MHNKTLKNYIRDTVPKKCVKRVFSKLEFLIKKNLRDEKTTLYIGRSKDLRKRYF
jgi:hypothetical protein